jgi:hypothetical protein
MEPFESSGFGANPATAPLISDDQSLLVDAIATSANPPNIMASSPAARRSNRERQSTTINIDGHTVLRTNNYVVKGGTYEFNEVIDLTVEAPPKRAIAPSSAKPKPPKKARTAKPAEVSRKAHNATVDAARQAKEALRQSFVRTHRDILRPFLTPDVYENLGRNPSVNYTAPSPPPPQPSTIQGTLRDYQSQGLEFLVKNHEQNLGMILGDEMGLVRICICIYIYI